MTAVRDWIRETTGGVSFAVRVAPRASRTGVSGILGEGANAILKVALAAPPVDGKANAELIAYFANILGVARSSVEVVSGKQSKNKVVRVSGKSAAEIAAVLARLLLGDES